MSTNQKRSPEAKTVKSSEGKILGEYIVSGGILIVQSTEGWSKRTNARPGDDYERKARLLLREGKPAV
jgi:hypothetical protein